MHEGGSTPSGEEQSPWSVWGIRLIAALAAALVVALGWAWIETFYRGVAVNGQLSFMSSDKPYMPIHTIAKPVIGDHYFGDFQFPLGYAINLRRSISPYLGPSIPYNYPPFSQVFFVLFSFLPLRISTMTYLLFSAAIFLVPLWLLLSPLKREYRILFLTLGAVFTTPFITFLDRGNDIGIVAGLVAWSLWAFKTEKWVFCGGLLGVAIALKAYPAAILIVPLGLRRYRFTVLVAASAVALNLITLLTFPGGYVRNLRAIVPALKGKYAPSIQLSSWSLYSVIPKTAGLLFGPARATQLLAPRGILIWLPSVLYVCGVYLVIRRGKVPQWCWGALGLASIQLIVPVNFVYTTAWAPIAAIWYARGRLIGIDNRESSEDAATDWIDLRMMLLLALIATLVPSIFTFSGAGGFNFAMTEYLSPALLFVTLCTAIAHSFWPMKRKTYSVS